VPPLLSHRGIALRARSDPEIVGPPGGAEQLILPLREGSSDGVRPVLERRPVISSGTDLARDAAPRLLARLQAVEGEPEVVRRPPPEIATRPLVHVDATMLGNIDQPRRSYSAGKSG